MIDFTQDERNLMMLYSPGTKKGLFEALMQMKEQLTKEETELCSLTVLFFTSYLVWMIKLLKRWIFILIFRNGGKNERKGAILFRGGERNY